MCAPRTSWSRRNGSRTSWAADKTRLTFRRRGRLACSILTSRDPSAKFQRSACGVQIAGGVDGDSRGIEEPGGQPGEVPHGQHQLEVRLSRTNAVESRATNGERQIGRWRSWAWRDAPKSRAIRGLSTLDVRPSTGWIRLSSCLLGRQNGFRLCDNSEMRRFRKVRILFA
jgi:hypothetical protein